MVRIQQTGDQAGCWVEKLMFFVGKVNVFCEDTMQPPVYYYSMEISHLSGIAFGLTSSGGNKTTLLFVGF